MRATASLLLLAAAALGCGRNGQGEQPRPNLVLLTLDTLRADHLQRYGYFRNTAPSLERLADESLVFERCIAPIAHTTPSHLSLLTSTYPIEHGRTANMDRSSMEQQARAAFVGTAGLITFPEHMLAQGYATGGFVSAAPLKRFTGISAGFEGWSEPPGSRRPGSETMRELLTWLDSQSGARPFLLWAHLFDAHGPYKAGVQPPEPFASHFDTDQALKEHLDERQIPRRAEGGRVGDVSTAKNMSLYDGSVLWLDQSVGELLAKLRARPDWDRTVVVVVGDHGQGLGQHDYLAHGEVWLEQLHVPLIMRIPGVAPGREPALMSLIDVLPTVLAAVPQLPGAGFVEQCRGTNALDRSLPRPPVYGMSPTRRGQATLLDGDWKYIRREESGESLFDLRTDPFELRDVAPSNTAEAERMRAALEALEAEQLARGEHHRLLRAEVTDDTAVDPEIVEQLRELGYLGEDEDEH